MIVTLAATVNGLAVPMNPGAGVKLTFPVSPSITYVPSSVVTESVFLPDAGSTSL